MGAYLPCRQHAPLLSLAPLRQQVIRALLAALGLGVPSLPPGLSVRIETNSGPSLFAGSPGGCLGHPTSCSSPGALLPGFLFLGHAGTPPWPLSSPGALSLAPRPRRLDRSARARASITRRGKHIEHVLPPPARCRSRRRALAECHANKARSSRRRSRSCASALFAGTRV